MNCQNDRHCIDCAASYTERECKNLRVLGEIIFGGQALGYEMDSTSDRVYPFSADTKCRECNKVKGMNTSECKYIGFVKSTGHFECQG